MTIFKKEYNYFKEARQYFKKIHPGLSELKAKEYAIKSLYEKMPSHEQKTRFLCFQADLEQVSTHIYLENEVLYQFLKSIKKIDIQDFKSFILSKHESLKHFDKIVCTDNNELVTSHVFIVHTPNKRQEVVFSVGTTKSNSVLLTVHTINRSDFVYLKKDVDVDLSTVPEALDTIYFCINLLIYTVTYPARLVDYTERKAGAKLLKTAPEILAPHSEAQGGHKTPHFRSGHFRYLGSPFFKNRQGSWVFVKSAVVGSAKILKSND